MMRNPRPEEQLRGGDEPWERKFEGKSRPYEQELHNMDRRCCKTENCRSFCEADANKIAKLVIGGSGSGGRDDHGHKRDY